MYYELKTKMLSQARDALLEEFREDCASLLGRVVDAELGKFKVTSVTTVPFGSPQSTFRLESATDVVDISFEPSESEWYIDGCSLKGSIEALNQTLLQIRAALSQELDLLHPVAQ